MGGSQSSAKRKGRTESSVADDVEAGRLSFEPRSSDLPFEAGGNRRGTKVKQLRQTLRKEEAKRRKLHEAKREGTAKKTNCARTWHSIWLSAALEAKRCTTTSRDSGSSRSSWNLRRRRERNSGRLAKTRE